MIKQDPMAVFRFEIIACAVLFGVFGIVGLAYSVHSTLGIAYFFLAIGFSFVALRKIKLSAGAVCIMLLVAASWRLVQII